MNERVLVIIKPDGMRKAIAGEIMSMFTNDDLRLMGIKLIQVTKAKAQEHYKHLKTKEFFADIVHYLTGELHGGSPVLAMVFSGSNAIKKCRAIAGATNPEDADPRSIRGKFGRITTAGVYENLVHVSSDKSEAEREIKLWFKSSEMLKV